MFKPKVLAFLLFLASESISANELSFDLSKIDRTIKKEPIYKSTPHYALLAIGSHAEHLAWLVIDGDDVAYIDRDGNGDLTDPSERIELDRAATDQINLGNPGAIKAFHVFPLGEVAGTRLTFRLWSRDTKYDVSLDQTMKEYPEFRKIHDDMRERGMENGSLMREAQDGMQAQIPLALTLKADDAQICHFKGPLSIASRFGKQQYIEPWPKQTNFEVCIGTRCLPPLNWPHAGFDFSPLTTSEVPNDMHPIAMIEYPSNSSDKPQRQPLVLDQRCCGDCFYTTLTCPKGFTAGIAKIVVTLPGWKDHDVESATFEVPINQKRSQTNEVAYVMFRNTGIELKHAVSALRKAKMEITIRGDVLLVEDGEELGIGIRLNRASEVQKVASGLGKESKFADLLNQCDARFEIGPFEPNKAEMIERIEHVLQELTRGVMYQTWDKKLSIPN